MGGWDSFTVWPRAQMKPKHPVFPLDFNKFLQSVPTWAFLYKEVLTKMGKKIKNKIKISPLFHPTQSALQNPYFVLWKKKKKKTSTQGPRSATNGAWLLFVDEVRDEVKLVLSQEEFR